MGLIKGTKRFIQAWKLTKGTKNLSLVKTGLEVGNDEDAQEKAKEMREIRHQHKKLKEEIEIKKEKIKAEIEFRRLQEELAELQEELDDDEDDDIIDGQMSPEQMFWGNIMNIFSKQQGQQPGAQNSNNSFISYPTGTNDAGQVAQPQFTPAPILQRSLSDEDIKHYLNFLTPEQQKVIGNIPEGDLLRAKELVTIKP